jgi:hypothetical protein
MEQTAPPPPVCAICNTTRDVMQRVRIRPRRDVALICDAVRRATVWPDSATPVWVDCCNRRDCYDAVRSAAVTILAVESTRGGADQRQVKD